MKTNRFAIQLTKVFDLIGNGFFFRVSPNCSKIYKMLLKLMFSYLVLCLRVVQSLANSPLIVAV